VDECEPLADGLHTRTNRSGGVQGGISNGEIIELKIAFKVGRCRLTL
jgi:chorismate synthase